MTVDLAAVANAQTIRVTLTDASDGTASGDVFISMGVLMGDTNRSGSVTSSDIGQTKSQSGQIANATNFRPDVNASGSITAPDLEIVKANSGTSLP
ncbi:MAG: dockerin type I domain-containing protein [Chthoniobacterales bacterium]